MRELAHILAAENREEFIEQLFDELLTKNERDMIIQRMKIVKLLKQKIPQYEISKKLNASLCSITRGAKELKKNNSALSQVADRYLIENIE